MSEPVGFLFLLFLHYNSFSSFSHVLFNLYSLLPLFSLSLGDDTKWPTRIEMSLNPQHSQYCHPLGNVLFIYHHSHPFAGSRRTISGERICTSTCGPLREPAHDKGYLSKLTGLDLIWWVDWALKPQHKTKPMKQSLNQFFYLFFTIHCIILIVVLDMKNMMKFFQENNCQPLKKFQPPMAE